MRGSRFAAASVALLFACAFAACANVPELSYPSASDAGGTLDGPPPVDGSIDAPLADAGTDTGHDAGAADAGAVDAGPIDSGNAVDGPVLSCVPNADAGTLCCPSGDQCVGMSCQHCGDCTTCAPPGVCCAVLNRNNKYTRSTCSATPVGCP